MFMMTHFLLLFLVLPVNADVDHICNNINVQDGKIKLNGNERSFVCGSDRGSEGWLLVPLPQAEFHLRSILQNSGFLEPRFERDAGELKVWKGPRSQIESLTVVGANDVLNAEKKRNVIREPLTPEKLDEVEAWSNATIRSQGYACPEILVEAQAWDKAVQVQTTLNGVKRIGSIQTKELDTLNPDFLKRYQPFSIGDVYDIRKTQIMSDRLLTNGLLQSAFFETKCQGEEVLLSLRTSVGKPRIIQFGIGASTEEFPFIDLTFRNSRLDNMASFLTGNIHLSPRRQRLSADSELYYFPGWHKTFLGPRFEVLRKFESDYETNSARLGADIGHNLDLWNTRFVGRAGPTLNYVRTIRGVGPGDAKFPSLDSSLNMMSHIYESNISQQYEGFSSSIFIRSQSQGLGSPVDVNRYEVNYKYLWNIGGYAPPLFVLSTRVQGITVDAADLITTAMGNEIPHEDRVFAGGDQNLRGFGRETISNDGLGYLSFLYTGFELRLVEEVPFKLQPFLLYDLARVGNRRYTLDPALFISEGIGLRWMSPFGTMRGSLARGRLINRGVSTETEPEKYVFFFSFGQEF